MANKEASLLLRIKTAGQEALDGLKSKFEDIQIVAVAAFAAISGAIVKAIAEYSAQEQAVNSLNRTLVNNGTYSREVSKAYQEQADALAKLTLFGDEQIIQAQSTFSQQARGIQLTKEQTKAILDFAQAQGMDAAQAAEVVGKSVGTATNALARYGIEVTKGATEGQKLEQVIAGLNNKFGGQAEAATQGLGVLQMLSKTVGELFEGLGARLAPVITLVAKEFNSMIGSAGGVDTFINAIGTGFEFIIKSAAGVAYAFQTVGTIVGGTLGTIAGN